MAGGRGQGSWPNTQSINYAATKYTNQRTGKRGTNRERFTPPPLGNPLSLVLLLVLLLLRSVGLWGSLVWLVTRQTNELRRRQ